MNFTILGKPVPLGRPRVRVVAIKGKKPFATIYPAPASSRWESIIRNTAGMEMRNKCWTTMTGPIAVSVFIMPQKLKSGKAPKRVGDLDNHVKAALDALNGVAFKDDSQVKEIHAFMSDPSDQCGLTINIKRLGE